MVAQGSSCPSTVCTGPLARIEKPAFQTRLTNAFELRREEARSTTASGTDAATASKVLARLTSPLRSVVSKAASVSSPIVSR